MRPLNEFLLFITNNMRSEIRWMAICSPVSPISSRAYFFKRWLLLVSLDCNEEFRSSVAVGDQTKEIVES
eukprot:scaffold1949_cov119-Cylindrotheca_fusiformis.AAC.6